MKLIHVFLPGTVNYSHNVWLLVKDSCARKDYGDCSVSTYASVYLKRALPNPSNPTLSFISDLSANHEHILPSRSSICQYSCAQLKDEETEAWYPGASCPQARHLVYRRAKPSLPGLGSCNNACCFSTSTIKRKASVILNSASAKSRNR